jgi:hypothetical protein
MVFFQIHGKGRNCLVTVDLLNGPDSYREQKTMEACALDGRPIMLSWWQEFVPVDKLGKDENLSREMLVVITNLSRPADRARRSRLCQGITNFGFKSGGGGGLCPAKPLSRYNGF